jgi:trehalose-phosphatase
MLEGGRLLVASDFDGTLSRMVPDPWSAAIIPGAQRALRRLSAMPDTHVALISGRTVADLAQRARIGGISYRGDHGAERAEAARGFRPTALRVEREAVTEAVAEMASRLKSEVPRQVDEPWLVLEDKGPALTFHFRAAPDVEAARARVIAAVDAVDTTGLMSRPGGRRSCELRPPGASTKGDALRALIDDHGPDTVLMIGDDGHDALAFDALRAFRDERRVVGLAVAVAGHADVTADVGPRADVVLRAPEAAARFLGLLCREVYDRT